MAKTYIKDINSENATDWQRTMFNALSPELLEKANVTFTTDKYGNLKKPEGVKTIGQYTPTGAGEDADQVYSQIYVKDLGTVNGIHLYANYDSQGKLTGFDEGRALAVTKPVTKVYSSENQYFRPSWDATGKATPVKGTDTKGGGLFSDFFGDVTSGFDDLVLQNPALRAALLSYAIPQITSQISADPNAVGGVTGPDNIDVGGGWSPSTGATAAELEAARAALEPAYPTGLDTLPPSVNTPEQAFGSTPEVTADQITTEIAGNPDKAALYGNAGYGDTLTSSQISAVDKAVAGGMTLSNAIDMVKGGLLINSLTGDPLGLSGNTGGTSGTTGKSGFSIVPVPADWKSPTYAPISAPIDLSTVLTSKNMLGSTQWENLPTQRNISFNDIFASGQQQTPMGSPVDLNNIVSAILGQAATSQKPA